MIFFVIGESTTVAGGGNKYGIYSTDGMGSVASFNFPYGVSVSTDGSMLVVADRNNHNIRLISTAGDTIVPPTHILHIEINLFNYFSRWL